MKSLKIRYFKKNPIVIISLTALVLFFGYIIMMLVAEQKRPSKCSCPYAASQNQKK